MQNGDKGFIQLGGERLRATVISDQGNGFLDVSIFFPKKHTKRDRAHAMWGDHGNRHATIPASSFEKS
jgi:hypothetical protein